MDQDLRQPAGPQAPDDARRSVVRARAGRLLLVLGGVFYLSNIIEMMAGWPLDPVHSVLSELAARDQPTSALARTTDLLAALFLLAGLVVLVGRSPRTSWRAWSWTARVVVAAGALLALATIADVALPLDCAVSVAECAARERAGDVSAAHRWHTVSSVVAGFAACVLCAATAHTWWSRWRTASVGASVDDDAAGSDRLLRAAALGSSGLGILATTWIVVDEELGLATGGVTQRIQIFAFCVVIALVGWTLPAGAGVTRGVGDAALRES